jgi:hypothetical protein
MIFIVNDDNKVERKVFMLVEIDQVFVNLRMSRRKKPCS